MDAEINHLTKTNGGDTRGCRILDAQIKSTEGAFRGAFNMAESYNTKFAAILQVHNPGDGYSYDTEAIE